MIMPAIAHPPTSDPWNSATLRVWTHAGQSSLVIPADYFGPRLEYGSLERVRKLAAHARQLDHAEWVLAGLRQLELLFVQPQMNEAFFSAMGPFEDKLEDAVRVSLGGVAIYSTPVAPAFTPSRSARPYVDPAVVSSLIQKSTIDGGAFHVDVNDSSVWFSHPNRYKLDAIEQELLRNDLSVTRRAILQGYGLNAPTRPTGDRSRRIEPDFPELEEPWPPVVEELEETLTEESVETTEAQNLDEVSAPPAEPTAKVKRAYRTRAVRISEEEKVDPTAA